MARQPGHDLPGIPQHIVQRGNNRLPCFLDDDDRQHYLTLLREALLDTGCKLHAYVLMDNHVHLLATPPQLGAVARFMQHTFDAATSASSTLATVVRGPCEKAATKRAWSTAEAMTCHATAISNSTPSALA
jgi:REP element-mobilizing transposase RayT